MKKTIFLLCIIVFSASFAKSQVLISILLGDKLNSDGLEFGLEGGVNWSNIGNMEAKESLANFNLGFYFDVRIKKQFSLYTGLLLKSNLGQANLKSGDLEVLAAQKQNENGNYNQVLNYFILPALGKYSFKNNFYIEAGAQFGLLHGAMIEYTSTKDNFDTRIQEDNLDELNRFDAGFTGGTGYKFPKGLGVSIGIKYYYGLLDVYKNISGSNNQSLFVKVNVPIGKGQTGKTEVE